MKFLAAAWIATCFLSALSFAQTDGPPKPPRTFTLRIPGEPETLDWNRAHTMVETYLLMNLMEGLVTFDSSMKVVPALAQSWTISADGRTYTFKLRTDVKWTDGVPLKAADFVFSWKRLLSPLTAASYSYFLYDIEGAEFFNKGTLRDFNSVGIKAIDDHTLQIKLSRPVAHWIDIPTFWVTFPLRQDVVEKYGNAWATPGRMVTLGPFSLAVHDIDTKIILKANPNYYGKMGNIEEVDGLIIKDDSTALSLYESGKLDFLTDISTLDLKRLAGRPDLKTFPYFKTGYMGFVTDKFPVSNVKLRKAIAMAIDKSKLSDILHGGQQPATSFVPPGLLAYSKSVGLKYDPIEARSTLRTSGLNLTQPLKLDFVLPNWDKASTLAQFIQGELKKNLGLEVDLQPFDNKTFRAQLDLKIFPLFEASWSADYPDPDNYLSVFISASGNNWTTWKSDKFDELVLTARGMLDVSAREKIYLDAQRILLEEQVAILPLYYEPNMALVRARVHNLELNKLNYLLLRKVNLAS